MRLCRVTPSTRAECGGERVVGGAPRRGSLRCRRPGLGRECGVWRDRVRKPMWVYIIQYVNVLFAIVLDLVSRGWLPLKGVFLVGVLGVMWMMWMMWERLGWCHRRGRWRR